MSIVRILCRVSKSECIFLQVSISKSDKLIPTHFSQKQGIQQILIKTSNPDYCNNVIQSWRSIAAKPKTKPECESCAEYAKVAETHASIRL